MPVNDLLNSRVLFSSQLNFMVISSKFWTPATILPRLYMLIASRRSALPSLLPLFLLLSLLPPLNFLLTLALHPAIGCCRLNVRDQFLSHPNPYPLARSETSQPSLCVFLFFWLFPHLGFIPFLRLCLFLLNIFYF